LSAPHHAVVDDWKLSQLKIKGLIGVLILELSVYVNLGKNQNMKRDKKMIGNELI
jgi:hypothetical protein